MASGIQVSDKLPCIYCKEIINEGEKVLKCHGFCNTEIHVNCSGYKPSEIKLLMTNPNVKWFCDHCAKQNTEEMIVSTLQMFTNELTSYREEIKLLKEEIKQQNENIQNLNKITSQIKTKQGVEHHEEIPILPVKTVNIADNTSNNRTVRERTRSTTKEAVTNVSNSIPIEKQMAPANNNKPQKFDNEKIKFSEVVKQNSHNEAEVIEDNEGFKLVRHKKPRKKFYGTAGNENENNFFGVKRRAWFFVSRVHNQVTEENIVDYLAKKTGQERNDFTVEEMKKKEDDTRSTKNFCVSADYSLKDLLYEPDFWPKNVSFRRYNFSAIKKSSNNFLESTMSQPVGKI